MLKWSNAFSRRQRASDRPQPRQPKPQRDRGVEKLIADEAIVIRFQPQIEPRTGAIVGVEALARWDRGGPEDLFARASAVGLQERLSRQIQRKALRMAAAWRGPLAGLHVSINLLPEDLVREGYDRWLLDEIASARIDPGRVTVEITESVLIEGIDAVAERLGSIRAAGVRIAVDDFGTGYASLAYLTTLPLDALKIDRGLIADLVGGTRDRIVVKALIQLTRELDLKVIVEGVESIDQLDLLAEWGCDAYQGFLGAGALSEEELERFVAASNVKAA